MYAIFFHVILLYQFDWKILRKLVYSSSERNKFFPCVTDDKMSKLRLLKCCAGVAINQKWSMLDVLTRHRLYIWLFYLYNIPTTAKSIYDNHFYNAIFIAVITICRPKGQFIHRMFLLLHVIFALQLFRSKICCIIYYTNNVNI